VRCGRAEGDRDTRKNVVLGGLRELAGIGGSPEEKGVDDTDAELQGGNGQREARRAAGGLERHLVAYVVVVVAKVPKGEVDDENNVDAALLLARSRSHLGNRVDGLGLNRCREEGHGTPLAQALISEEHAGTAAGETRHIAPGADQGGLRTQQETKSLAKYQQRYCRMCAVQTRGGACNEVRRRLCNDRLADVHERAQTFRSGVGNVASDAQRQLPTTTRPKDGTVARRARHRLGSRACGGRHGGRILGIGHKVGLPAPDPRHEKAPSLVRAPQSMYGCPTCAMKASAEEASAATAAT
jgi:hypothetical protein